MTAFLLIWPSVALAEMGDPRPQAPADTDDLLAGIEARVAEALKPLTEPAPDEGAADQRWYWAAPLFSTSAHIHPSPTLCSRRTPQATGKEIRRATDFSPT